MMYAYIRVSKEDQNVDRQIEGAKKYCPDIEGRNVYFDKKSGRDMNRPGYEELNSTLRRGDELVVHELDRLGRDKE